MNRIIVIKDGAIVEEGTHAQLIQIDDGLYKKLWELQSPDQTKSPQFTSDESIFDTEDARQGDEEAIEASVA